MGHVLNSQIYRDMFGTAEMREVFSEHSQVQGWIDAEVALARAEAAAGVIPTAAAAEIDRHADARLVDLDTLKQQTELVGYPIVPLVQWLASQCADGAGQYVHWGATTQDIMDTGLILQIRRAYNAITRDLDRVIDAAAMLASQNRDVPMAGRTHGQQAVPITFGFKVSVWVAELARHQERLRAVAPRLLVGQLGGAAGTLAALGPKGLAVQTRMMEELGLGVPPIAWHVARDTLAEFVALLALICATIAKIAQEIALLQQTEVAEVAESHVSGKGSSSTMPQKRNPISCEILMAIGSIVAQDAATMLAAMRPDHERATGPWYIEWEVIPEVCILTGGAIHQAASLLHDLVVLPQRMLHNLELTKGLIASEAVMMVLAPVVGRQRAHDLVYRAAMKATQSNQPLEIVLREDVEIMEHLSVEQLRAALDPTAYTGLSTHFVDRVLATVNASSGKPTSTSNTESTTQARALKTRRNRDPHR